MTFLQTPINPRDCESLELAFAPLHRRSSGSVMRSLQENIFSGRTHGRGLPRENGQILGRKKFYLRM